MFFPRLSYGHASHMATLLTPRFPSPRHFSGNDHTNVVYFAQQSSPSCSCYCCHFLDRRPYHYSVYLACFLFSSTSFCYSRPPSPTFILPTGTACFSSSPHVPPMFNCSSSSTFSGNYNISVTHARSK